MQAQTWLILTVVGVALLAAVMYMVGFAAGAAEARRTRRVRLITGIVIASLLSWSLVPFLIRFGPLVLEEAALIAGALYLGFAGGFISGAGRRSGKGALPVLFLMAVLSVLDIGAFYVVNLNLYHIAVEAGFIHEATNGSELAALPAGVSPADHLKDLYVAFTQYASSNDGKLPPSDKWMDNDDLKGYIIKDESLHDPAVSNGHDAVFGFAYNDAVAGRKLKEIPDAAKTPLLYQSTNLERSAHDAITSLPKPGRSNGKNYVLYCDGHVDAVTP